MDYESPQINDVRAQGDNTPSAVIVAPIVAAVVYTTVTIFVVAIVFTTAISTTVTVDNHNQNPTN